jgi:hypothetical protein
MREFAKVSFVAATASDPGRGDERADASEWDKRKGEVERDQWFFFFERRPRIKTVRECRHPVRPEHGPRPSLTAGHCMV